MASQLNLGALPKVKAPFLPENTSQKLYTLVLDLDETLIHFVDLS
jgi:CTD small phosphatase-like protein 2